MGGGHKSASAPTGGPQPGMMDDAYWSRFTSNADEYELGPQIGFGASSSVHAALFRPSTPASLGPVTTNEVPPSTSGPERGARPAKGSKGASRPTLQLDTRPLAPASSSAYDQGPGTDSIPCAIKVSSARSDMAALSREIKLLSLCRHPNVLRVLATFTLPPDHQRVYIVTPLVEGGSLAGILDWRTRLAEDGDLGRTGRWGLGRAGSRGSREPELPRRGRLTEEEIKAVLKQALDGLRYLHERAFVHRDIKAGNLLVASDGTVLLADLGVGGDLLGPQTPRTDRLPVEAIRFERPLSLHGVSRPAPPSASAGGPRRKASFVGTPGFMAPEVILGRPYDASADVWSLGMTVIELAEGAVPDSDGPAGQLVLSLLQSETPSLRYGSGTGVDLPSKAMQDFVGLCLRKDPAERHTASQLSDHPWLKNAKKPAFLGESLLAGLPAIEARQEVRRMPSLGLTPASPAPSWDFAPSAPSSPVRHTVRSPSVYSASVSRGEYFPALSRPQSRASLSHPTRSRMPSLPPSPRVPLRQWAERTASLVESDGDGNGGGGDLSLLKVRSPSEGTGMGRGAQRAERTRSGSGLRRGTPSVDGLAGWKVPAGAAAGTEALDEGAGESSERQRRRESMDGLGLDGAGTDTSIGMVTSAAPSRGKQMSPLIEAQVQPSVDTRPPAPLQLQLPSLAKEEVQPVHRISAGSEGGTMNKQVPQQRMPAKNGGDRAREKQGLGGLIRSFTRRHRDSRAA